MRKTLKGFILAATLIMASAANAGMLSVFADVNIFNPTLPTGNDQVALNLLGAGTNVLISSQNGIGGVTATGLNNFYNGLMGVTNNRSIAELSNAILSGIDLLVLDVNFNVPQLYDATETSLIASFLSGGGNVALIAEADDVGALNSYNALLAGIGSSILYDAVARCCGGFHLADTILPTSLTAGVNSFTFAAANNLLGGTAAIQDQGFTVVAIENIGGVVGVPEPTTLLLMGLGFVGLGFARRRKSL